jgi:hypothetical protein
MWKLTGLLDSFSTGAETEGEGATIQRNYEVQRNTIYSRGKRSPEIQDESTCDMADHIVIWCKTMY